jgi:hypothetical protein
MPPPTLQAFTVLIFGIAPGFVAIRGFSRRRYRTVPDRDLYAIAGAAVVSAIWLGFLWLLLLLLGDPLREWGVIPYSSALLEEHRADVVWLGLAAICLPFPLGSLAAISLDFIEGRFKKDGSKAWAFLRWAGFFRPPTAWDKAWLRFARKYGAGEVIVQMQDGLIVRGGFGKSSQADLSPNAPHLFLESGYGYLLADGDSDSDPSAVSAGDGPQVVGRGSAGVYLAGAQINSVYFIPPAEGTAQGPPGSVEEGPSGDPTNVDV